MRLCERASNQGNRRSLRSITQEKKKNRHMRRMTPVRKSSKGGGSTTSKEAGSRRSRVDWVIASGKVGALSQKGQSVGEKNRSSW